MKLRTIINPVAGQEEPVLAVLARVLGEAGVELDVRITRGADDASRFAHEALADRVDVVAAYGGDGTVAAAAAALAGTETPLAILPGGTGNAIARDLGIPLELEPAVELAIHGSAGARPVDAMAFGERLGLLRIGVGADARLVRDASRERKNRWGWSAYLFEALAQMYEGERTAYRLAVDGEELEVEALTCLVANIGRLGRGDLTLGHEISPFDGKLDVLVIRDADLGSVAALGASLLGLRDPGADGALWHLQAARVRIESDTPQAIHCDGDLAGETPIDVEVRAGAVRIVLPAPAAPLVS